MARIYESAPAGNEYRGQVESQGFRPVQAYDPSNAIKEQSERNVEDAKTLARASQRQAQLDSGILQARHQIEDATQRANAATLNGLLSLSGTFLKGFKEMGEIQQQLAEEDALLESLFMDDGKTVDLTPDEQQKFSMQKTELDANAKATEKVAGSLESTGNIQDQSVANTIRQTSPTQYNLGIASNSAQATAMYPAFMAEFMANQKSGSAAENMAALREGTRQFMRATGMMGAPREQLVKFARSIQGYQQSILMNATSQGIRQTQEDNLAEDTAYAYNLGKTTNRDNLRENLNAVLERFGSSNNGLGRGTKSNTEGLRHYLTALAMTGDAGLIEDARRFELSNGATVGSLYGAEFDRAVELAERKHNQFQAKQAEDIEGNMYLRLGQAKSPDEKAGIVEQAARAYEQAGLYKKAHELRQEQQSLTIEGQHAYNGAEIQMSIMNGEITDIKTVKQALDRGLITMAEYNQAESALNEIQTAATSEMKDSLKAYSDRFESNLLIKLGIKKDPNGGYVPSPAAGAIDPGSAKLIVSRAEADMKRALLTVALQSQNLSPSEKMAALQKAGEDWYNANVKTPGAKYYIPNEKVSYPSPEEKAASMEYFRKMAQAANLNRMPSGIKSAAPKDWSGFINPGGRAGAELRRNFRPLRGDTVFNREETMQLADAWNRGSIPSSLKATASSLGMTPMALMNSQLRAHQLDGVLPIEPTGGGTFNGRVVDGVSGANYLMQRHNMPARGAAWFAGNVQQESGWYGQRAPWDDGGALSGGLISWRAGRLSNIERQGGGSIQNIPNEKQLDLAMQEMASNPRFAEANRIFRNPYSTERDLKRASMIYWGYGEEGNRYGYAQQIEAKLRSQGRGGGDVSAAGSGQDRAVSVGRKLLSMGVGGIWQNPAFDVDKGYVGKGGRVGQHSPNSYHYSGQALDIPLSHNSAEQASRAFDYLKRNMTRLGIAELYFNQKGFYRNGRLIGGPGSNAIPNHDSHIHVAFN
jgi:hypothetical protein